ncbi:MAG: hypothetical protein M1827_003043 [Pycnora praestabilis]|nr:MAG: hypothetical protein M1827_003043 [Pycnora praestabilis]
MNQVKFLNTGLARQDAEQLWIELQWPTPQRCQKAQHITIAAFANGYWTARFFSKGESSHAPEDDFGELSILDRGAKAATKFISSTKMKKLDGEIAKAMKESHQQAPDKGASKTKVPGYSSIGRSPANYRTASKHWKTIDKVSGILQQALWDRRT